MRPAPALVMTEANLAERALIALEPSQPFNRIDYFDLTHPITHSRLRLPNR